MESDAEKGVRENKMKSVVLSAVLLVSIIGFCMFVKMHTARTVDMLYELTEALPTETAVYEERPQEYRGKAELLGKRWSDAVGTSCSEEQPTSDSSTAIREQKQTMDFMGFSILIFSFQFETDFQFHIIPRKGKNCKKQFVNICKFRRIKRSRTA